MTNRGNLIAAIKQRRESIELEAQRRSEFLESSHRIMKTFADWASSVPGLTVKKLSDTIPWIKIHVPFIGAIEIKANVDTFKILLVSNKNIERRLHCSNGDWYCSMELVTEEMFFGMVQGLLAL